MSPEGNAHKNVAEIQRLYKTDLVNNVISRHCPSIATVSKALIEVGLIGVIEKELKNELGDAWFSISREKKKIYEDIRIRNEHALSLEEPTFQSNAYVFPDEDLTDSAGGFDGGALFSKPQIQNDSNAIHILETYLNSSLPVYNGSLKDEFCIPGLLRVVTIVNGYSKNEINKLIQELRFLINYRHPRLVQLHGYHLEVSGQDSTSFLEKLSTVNAAPFLLGLILPDYCSAKNTLRRHMKSLDNFVHRLSILRDVAQALAFLHEFAPRTTPHGNVTSSNIFIGPFKEAYLGSPLVAIHEDADAFSSEDDASTKYSATDSSNCYSISKKNKGSPISDRSRTESPRVSLALEELNLDDLIKGDLVGPDSSTFQQSERLQHTSSSLHHLPTTQTCSPKPCEPFQELLITHPVFGPSYSTPPKRNEACSFSLFADLPFEPPDLDSESSCSLSPEGPNFDKNEIGSNELEKVDEDQANYELFDGDNAYHVLELERTVFTRDYSRKSLHNKAESFNCLISTNKNIETTHNLPVLIEPPKMGNSTERDLFDFISLMLEVWFQIELTNFEDRRAMLESVLNDQPACQNSRNTSKEISRMFLQLIKESIPPSARLTIPISKILVRLDEILKLSAIIE